METADHADGQPTLAIENLGDVSLGADERLQIPARRPLLLDVELDGLDRIGV